MKKGGQKKLTLLAKFSYEPYIYREKGLTPFIPPPLLLLVDISGKIYVF